MYKRIRVIDLCRLCRLLDDFNRKSITVSYSNSLQTYEKTGNNWEKIHNFVCVNSDLHPMSPAESLAAYLGERGMRRTEERQAILDVAMSLRDGFDAAMLHSLLEARGYHVTVSTVYSAVKLFLDARLICRMPSHGNVARYRPCPAASVPPLELVCTVCGARRAVRSAYLSRAVMGHRFASFRQTSFALSVEGLCGKCQRRQASETQGGRKRMLKK